MADLRINPVTVDEDGQAAVYITPTTTDTYLIANNGKMFLHCKKTGAGACNAVIQTPGSVRGLAIADRTVVVPATTGDVFIGPFAGDVYSPGGDVVVTFSEITGLSVGAFQLT